MSPARSSMRAGAQAWAGRATGEQPRLRRALAALGHEGGDAPRLDELALDLVHRAAERHEQRMRAVVERMDPVLDRLFRDLDDLEVTGTVGRDPAQRAADLQVVAEALEELTSFEVGVRRGLTEGAGEFQDLLRSQLGGARAGGGAPAPGSAVGAGPDASGVVPRLATSRERGDRHLQWSREVYEAWRAGRTLEHPGVEAVDVGWRDAPLLQESMERMAHAVDAYRTSRDAVTDPAAAARATEDLRAAVAEASEVLRSFGRRFETATEGDVLPPRAVLPRTADAPAGTPAAAALTARRRAEALAGADVAPQQLVDALHFSTVRASGTGSLSEPLDRALPGMGLESFVHGAEKLRGLRTRPPWLARRLADLVDGWERAHLIGPGFGGEVFAGLMLAPWGVNQLAQNRGIEDLLRGAAGASRRTGGPPITPTVTATGRRLAIPLASGRFEHMDVLTSVRYEIPRPVGEPLHVAITVELNGSWRVEHDLPADTWPVDVPLTGTR